MNIDETITRIATAIGEPNADLPMLLEELSLLTLSRAETGEQHARICAIEKRIAEITERREQRRNLGRRLGDQAEAAAVRVALEEIERKLTAYHEARRRVTFHDVAQMIHTARSALSVDHAREVKS